MLSPNLNNDSSSLNRPSLALNHRPDTESLNLTSRNPESCNPQSLNRKSQGAPNLRPLKLDFPSRPSLNDPFLRPHDSLHLSPTRKYSSDS